MHRPTSAGRHRGTLAGLRLSHSRTTLEDRLSAHRHSASGTLTWLRRSHRSCRTSLLRRRRIYRTRSSLGRDHPTHWSRRRLRALLLRGGIGDRSGWGLRRRRRLRNLHCRWSLSLLRGRRLSRSRRLRSGHRGARSRSGRLLSRRRCSRRRRRGERWTRAEHRLDHALRRSFRSGSRRRSGNWLLSNRSGGRCRFRRRCGRGRDRLRRERRGCFSFLLQQKASYISRLGDVREIDLCLDLRLGRTRSAVASCACGAWSGEVFAHTIGLVGLDRARVRLLFRYSNQGEDVENRFALDFQFPCQIVDSNFTHSALCISPKTCFSRSSQPST